MILDGSNRGRNRRTRDQRTRIGRKIEIRNELQRDGALDQDKQDRNHESEYTKHSDLAGGEAGIDGTAIED